MVNKSNDEDSLGIRPYYSAAHLVFHIGALAIPLLSVGPSLRVERGVYFDERRRRRDDETEKRRPKAVLEEGLEAETNKERAGTIRRATRVGGHGSIFEPSSVVFGTT